MRNWKAILGVNNLLYFAKNIIGFQDVNKEVHGKLCSILQDNTKKKKLILLPRGSFKTSVATISYPIWCLIKNPNLRILIDSEVYENSKNYLKAIRLIFETNKELRLLYGNYVSKRGWLDESLQVAKRNVIFKEPSIDISSVDTVKVGMHYDKIIVDDICSDKNTSTAEQRQKVIDHYKLLLSILEPNGELIFCGTCWHWADLYAYLIEENKKEDKEENKFLVYIERAIKEDKSLFFPERLSQNFLDDQLKKQGTFIFSTQYQNMPTNIEEAYFKNLNYYDRLKEVPKELYICTTVDPAIGEKKTADFFAILTCGVDKYNNLWVLDYVNKHLKPYDAIKEMFIARQKWHPNSFAIETNNFQKLYKYELERYEKKYGILLPIEELQHTQKSKKMRIIALQPYFEQGKVFVRKSMLELVDQIFTFPRAKYDDLIETLAMVLEVQRIPWKDTDMTEEEKKEEELLLKPWLRRPQIQKANFCDILGTEW